MRLTLPVRPAESSPVTPVAAEREFQHHI
jgi:hypothetical protein